MLFKGLMMGHVITMAGNGYTNCCIVYGSVSRVHNWLKPGGTWGDVGEMFYL